MAKVFGGGTMGTKIAEYIMAVQRGKLDAQLDLLPTDKYEEPEPEPGEPTQKSRTVKQARKSKTANADKPFPINEIDAEKEEEFSQDQSKSVKVNQTDLAQPQTDDKGPAVAEATAPPSGATADGMAANLGTDERKNDQCRSTKD